MFVNQELLVKLSSCLQHSLQIEYVHGRNLEKKDEIYKEVELLVRNTVYGILMTHRFTSKKIKVSLSVVSHSTTWCSSPFLG